MTATALPVVLAAILAVALGYMLIVPTALNLPRFLRRFGVDCPTYQTHADVEVNALSAALSAGYGAPHLHVRRCTLLNPWEKCDEGCLKCLDA